MSNLEKLQAIYNLIEQVSLNGPDRDRIRGFIRDIAGALEQHKAAADAPAPK